MRQWAEIAGSKFKVGLKLVPIVQAVQPLRSVQAVSEIIDSEGDFHGSGILETLK